MAGTVVSRDGHDISFTTTNRPTNAEPGMYGYDSTLNAPCVTSNAGTMLPLAAMLGSAAVVAAGTNQATAAALTTGTLNVVTAADGTKGVVLPTPVVGGLEIFNNSTSPLYVYPGSTNTINGGSASAAVLIRANSSAKFVMVSSSAWGAVFSSNNSTVTIGASTAAAGSTTSDAGALPSGTAGVYLTTAADGTKGVRISSSDNVAGREIRVANGVSNAILKVYPPTGGTINGAAADAAFSTASGKGGTFICTAAGTWYGW